jgi:enoyl-CoA hydratase/carnithine racemase
LDLDWVLAYPEQMGAYIADVHALLAKMLEAEVLTHAIELARPLAGKDPGTLSAIKATIYTAGIAALQPASDVTVS